MSSCSTMDKFFYKIHKTKQILCIRMRLFLYHLSSLLEYKLVFYVFFHLFCIRTYLSLLKVSFIILFPFFLFVIRNKKKGDVINERPDIDCPIFKILIRVAKKLPTKNFTCETGMFVLLQMVYLAPVSNLNIGHLY